MRAKMLFVNSIVMGEFVPISWRSAILRLLGFKLGSRTFIGSGSRFKGSTLQTGTDCFINHDSHFDSGPLTLGDGVFVGPRCVFVTRDHHLGPAHRRAGKNVDSPIVIGDGCWIGANVTILGNVRVGPGAVVAAGAVVTKDLAANCLYGGVPARLIRSL